MIKLADVNAYYQDFHVLKNVSLVVKKGQIVVMLGPNGHGKSTVLKSICGLVKKVSGLIRFEGENITGLGSEKLVDMGITYIAENRELFPQMSVLENLKLGAYSRSARAFEKDNLERVFDLFPRLRDRRSQLAATMSGGEARMLAIARGLMSNARFLAIDEPSLGLQPNLRDEVARIIKQINGQGITLLVVEQNIPQITELADKFYVLEEGGISFEGSKEDALGNDHLKEIFLGM
ncbi:MAG: ABC transporter ATP-binding protein [Desulfotignum sp.]|jgi:branched-chain amino acid transport system ATP-binding protein|nr:ABC transporter ATP-binding protein [Desulfotignum sp.]